MTFEIHKIGFENNKFIERDKTNPEQTIIKNVFKVNWEDDVKNYHISFNFTTNEEIELGQAIELYEKEDDVVIFRGFIRKSIRSAQKQINYEGYDIGYLLSKLSYTFDFKGTCISDAISRVCSDSNFPGLVNIKKDETRLTRIYRNKILKDVIYDILNGNPKLNKYTGPVNKNYFIDCSTGVLELKEYQICNDLYGKVSNLYVVKSLDTIQNDFKITYSIDIEGLPKEDDTLTILGDYKARKGVIIKIDNKELRFNDYYLIERSKHQIQGSVEKVQIYIKKVIL